MCYNELKYLQQSVPALLQMCDFVTIMDNGSTDGSLDYLTSQPIKLLRNQQTFPPDYAALTNKLLDNVSPGATVIRLAPDEYPSNEMLTNIRAYIKGGTALIGVYHLMKSPRQCLPIEYPGYHQRIYPVTSALRYSGNVHEQANYPSPCYNIPVETGVALLHFSYLEEARLRAKSVMYSQIPGSGFTTPDALASRLSLDTLPLPDYIQYGNEHTFAKELCND